jgi:hypothetical protein
MEFRWHNGKKVYLVKIDVKSKLGDAEGTLKFRTFHQGQPVGTASINFIHT